METPKDIKATPQEGGRVMDKQRLEEIKLSASLYQQTTSDQGVRLMMDALFEVIEAYEQATNMPLPKPPVTEEK
jgi:hypothetical protein